MKFPKQEPLSVTPSDQKYSFNVGLFTLHGPDAAASPYADLAPPPARIYSTGKDVKAAAKKAFRRLGWKERTSVCRTRG